MLCQKKHPGRERFVALAPAPAPSCRPFAAFGMDEAGLPGSRERGGQRKESGGKACGIRRRTRTRTSTGQGKGKTRRGKARECVALLPFTTPVHDVGVAGGR
jgi:hypothetical protein